MDDDAGSRPSPAATTAAPITDDEVEERALSWIRNVVIGYGLCPFADRPLREGRLRLSVVRGDDDEEVAAAVVYELVSRSDGANPGTTVVIAPEYHPDDFERYMSLVSYIEEDVMDELDLVGRVQLAPFHPQFVFDGSGSDGIDNFTNRGPYPMFHVLREDEVSIAVDKLDGDAGKVWRRNVDLLGRMEGRYGREGAARIMEGGGDRGGEGAGGALPEGMDELLREVRGSQE